MSQADLLVQREPMPQRSERGERVLATWTENGERKGGWFFQRFYYYTEVIAVSLFRRKGVEVMDRVKVERLEREKLTELVTTGEVRDVADHLRFWEWARLEELEEER